VPPREYPQSRFAPPPGATDLLLVRHGQSAPAREGEPFPLVDGQGDPPLTELGREQGRAVARRLADAGLGAVYVTTLQRTRQTAQPLLDATGLEPRVEPDLREVHLGEWEGGVFRQRVAQRDPVALRMYEEERWDVIPGAEPSAALAERVAAAVRRICAAHPDERVAVVTHGGVIGQVLALATGSRPFAFVGADNGSLSQVVVDGDRWRLRRFNDTAHLPDDLSLAAAPPT
jgi:2,3-bisphosphoglycerate-dependent phosphoglycerate mutase